MNKTMTPKAKQKLVYVQWQDAHTNSGWMTSEQLEKNINNEMSVCEQVGWIVYEDAKEIHLIARRAMWEPGNAASSEYDLHQRIPRGWILKRKLIRR